MRGLLPPLPNVSALRTSAALLLAAALGACAVSDPEGGRVDIPPGILYFPSGAARAGDLLLVTSSNFDLRFQSGRLSAFSIAAIDEAIQAAGAPEGCPTGDACRPVELISLPEPVDTVKIGDFSGEVAVARVGTGLRAFVPVRSESAIVAVDIGADGTLTCARGGGEDCVGDGVSFAVEDPFQVLVLGDRVYVGHVQRTGSRTNGVIGAAAASGALWTRSGAGRLATIQLGETAVGGLAGTCTEPTCTEGGTVYATGRTTAAEPPVLYAFDFVGPTLISSSVSTLDLTSQADGRDLRGIAVSASGEQGWVVWRAPDTLASIDLTRIPARTPDACAIAAGASLPDEGCPAGQLSPGIVPVPAFDVSGAVPTPAEPRALTAIPRTLPDGTTSDLLVLTARRGLSFYDTRTGMFAGEVQATGDVPAAVVAVPRGEGVRLYVPSFASGRLAVVDVPDLFAPYTARVVALVGEAQSILAEILEEGGF